MRTIGRILTFPLVLAIQIYRATVSPLLPPACRFTPSCSVYFETALKTWGPVRGTWLGVRRILRCRPFSPGGYDPVPERKDEVREPAAPRPSPPRPSSSPPPRA